MDDEQVMDPGGEALAARVTELEGLLTAATERATALEGRWRDSVLQGALGVALHGAGCRDVEAALALLPRDGLRVGDDGAVQGVAEAVGALKAARAYLFPTRTAGGSANPAATATPANPVEALARWLRGEGL